ncbi:MAG TPA: hypothetical protein VKT28_10885 [Puia sp.]|nr:hypothetical protein [Puia sp.]
MARISYFGFLLNIVTIKTFLIILAAVIVFGGLVLAKIYVDKNQKKQVVVVLSGQVADTSSLAAKIKSDSLYDVKEVLFKDSGVLISVSNPDKSGTEAYFDKKYKLNNFDNINMVYIFQYDASKPLQTLSFEDAAMAKGKRMGRFQEEWVARFIDTTDGSCKPLKQYVQSSIKNPGSYKNEMTSYQPENIYKMRVVCKYTFADSAGTKTINNISAIVDTAGKVVSVEKNQ